MALGVQTSSPHFSQVFHHASFNDLVEKEGLTVPQATQLLSNRQTSQMFAGHLVHNLAKQPLDAEYLARFTYNVSKGADITGTLTGRQVEIATQAQEAFKRGKYPWADVATYNWNPRMV